MQYVGNNETLGVIKLLWLIENIFYFVALVNEWTEFSAFFCDKVSLFGGS